VPDSVDAAIRARFPVRLDRAGMQPRSASQAGGASATTASAQQVRA